MCQYDSVCKQQFAELKKQGADTKQAVDHLIKKLFQSNGERALVEIIRDNTEGRKRQDDRIASLENGIVSTPKPVMKKTTRIKMNSLLGGFEISGTDVWRSLAVIGIIYIILAQNGLVPVLNQ